MKTKALLFLAALLLCANDATATVGDIIKSDGLWFRVVEQYSADGGIVEVCQPQNGETYTGEIEIPGVIETKGEVIEGKYFSHRFSVSSIGAGAFQGCSGLTVHIPESLRRIMPTAFVDCSDITLVISNLSTWCKMEYTTWDSYRSYYKVDDPFLPWVDWLVLDGQRLTSVDIPDDVTTLGNAFRGYRNLVSVSLPASLMLSNNAFQGCENLSSVFVHREAPYPIPATVFEGVSSSCALYVPKDMKEDFAECGWTDTLFPGGIVETDEVPVATGLGITIFNFPDAHFRSYLRTLTEGEDGIFTETDISAIKKIDVTWKEMESLKGIEHFTSLELLRCGYNKLNEVDLSKNANLTYLDVAYNPIARIDVSHNAALKTLHCYGCGLTSLDISRNPQLQLLWCSENHLSSLDLSCCPVLDVLTCDNNVLTSLDLSSNPKMWELDCHNNKLTELSIAGCDNLNYLECYNNQLASLGVAGLKHLKLLNCYLNSIPSLDLTEATELQYFNCSVNPLKSLDLTNNKALIEFTCSACQLTELLLPEASTVESIDCGHNRLVSLDASGNARLNRLVCNNNQLQSLDVSDCDNLRSVRCNNNMIAADEMDKLIAGLPTRAYNLTSYLDVINEAGDGNNISDKQIQAAKDKSWTPRKCSSDQKDWTMLNVATAVMNNVVNQPRYDSVVYNLHGQRHHALQKGLNIVDGKKILVK